MDVWFKSDILFNSERIKLISFLFLNLKKSVLFTDRYRRNKSQNSLDKQKAKQQQRATILRKISLFYRYLVLILTTPD